MGKPTAKERQQKVVEIICDHVGITDEKEREAVAMAIVSRGKRAGGLKANAPNHYDYPMANAAWNGIQPNYYKMQISNIMFQRENERALFDKLDKVKWPAILDRDMYQLILMGVW